MGTDIDRTAAIALTPTNIVQELAAAVCEQLTSCCGESDQNDFFINFIDDERLAELAPRMPPNAPLEADTCPHSPRRTLSSDLVGLLARKGRGP